MLLNNLPIDNTPKDQAYTLYSEDGQHAHKMRRDLFFRGIEPLGMDYWYEGTGAEYGETGMVLDGENFRISGVGTFHYVWDPSNSPDRDGAAYGEYSFISNVNGFPACGEKILDDEVAQEEALTIYQVPGEFEISDKIDIMPISRRNIGDRRAIYEMWLPPIYHINGGKEYDTSVRNFITLRGFTSHTTAYSGGTPVFNELKGSLRTPIILGPNGNVWDASGIILTRRGIHIRFGLTPSSDNNPENILNTPGHYVAGGGYDYIWLTFGNDAGPLPVPLDYPDDSVYRRSYDPRGFYTENVKLDVRNFNGSSAVMAYDQGNAHIFHYVNLDDESTQQIYEITLDKAYNTYENDYTYGAHANTKFRDYFMPKCVIDGPGLEVNERNDILYLDCTDARNIVIQSYGETIGTARTLSTSSDSVITIQTDKSYDFECTNKGYGYSGKHASRKETFNVGTNGVRYNNIIMKDASGNWQSIRLNNSSSYTSQANRVPFDPSRLLYTTRYGNAGSIIQDAASNVYMSKNRVSTKDLNGRIYRQWSYSNNTELYLVGTIDSNGLFTIVSNNDGSDGYLKVGKPTSDDGRYYIYLGQYVYEYDDTTSTEDSYLDFAEENPIYFYKNGGVRRYYHQTTSVQGGITNFTVDDVSTVSPNNTVYINSGDYLDLDVDPTTKACTISIDSTKPVKADYSTIYGSDTSVWSGYGASWYFNLEYTTLYRTDYTAVIKTKDGSNFPDGEFTAWIGYSSDPSVPIPNAAQGNPMGNYFKTSRQYVPGANEMRLKMGGFWKGSSVGPNETLVFMVRNGCSKDLIVEFVMNFVVVDRQSS